MVFIIVGHLISRHFTIVRRTTEPFPPMPPHMFFLPLWYAPLHLNVHSCFLAYAMSEREDGEILQEVLENGTRLKRTRDCWQEMAGSTKGNGGPGLRAREMTILRRDAIQKNGKNSVRKETLDYCAVLQCIDRRRSLQTYTCRNFWHIGPSNASQERSAYLDNSLQVSFPGDWSHDVTKPSS